MAHEYYSTDYIVAPQGQAPTYQQQGAYQQAGYPAPHSSAYQPQQGYPRPGYNTAYYQQQVPGYVATHAGGWQQAVDQQQHLYQQYGVQDGHAGGSLTSAGVGALPPLPSDPSQPPLPEGDVPQLPSEPAPPLPEQPPLPSDPPGGTAPPLPPGPVGPQASSEAYVGPAGGTSEGQLPYPPPQHTQDQQQGGTLAGQYVQYPQQQTYQQQQAYQQPQYLQQQQYVPYPGQHQQQQGYYGNGWGGSGHAYGHAGPMPYASTLTAGPPYMQHAGMPYPQHQLAATALPQGYLQQQQQQQQAGPAPAAVPAAQPPLRPQRGELAELLQSPGRAKRPKRLVLLLRGLPGSGKSRLARLVRDRETEQGGKPPRILSLDDYFMTEVEREVEEDEGGAGASGKKGRKRKVQVMEYCYEPEMEGVYKRSLLKAYQRTLDEARFKFVIVDAPNIWAADFRDFWMAGQAAGYEIFVVEMPESDPQVCHQRNQRRRKLEDLYRLSAEYEPTPAVYACLDASSLLAKKQPPGGKSAISDVDMGEDEVEGSDTEGDTPAGAPSSSRWASLEDDSSSPAAERSKRARLTSNGSTSSLDRAAVGGRGGGSTQSMRVADRSAGGDGSYDGLADGIDEMLGRAVSESRGTGKAGSGSRARSGSSGSGRGILSSGAGGSGSTKRVRWPDQMEEDERADAGFRIGAESRQLETVYLVEGLGPPSGGTHPHPASFAAAVKAEHQVEANAFRSVMLGGAPKRLPGGGGSSSKGA
ncbi:hypothetical protein N2152v2_010086 [Parachlorella kessleri]